MSILRDFHVERGLIKGILRVLVLSGLSLSLGCTKAVPTFELLASVAVAGPTFSGSPEYTASIPSVSQDVTILGTCPADFQNLEWSTDGGATWAVPADSPGVTTSVAGCTGGGGFSITIGQASPLYSFTNVGDKFTVYFRGTVADTQTQPGIFHVKYEPLPGANLNWSIVPANPHSADSVMAVQIEIRNGNGAIVTEGPDATAAITLSLPSGVGPLGGNLSVQAIGGVADFSVGDGLALRLVGSKVLRATKADLAASGGGASLFADTAPFDVKAGAAVSLGWVTQPADPVSAGDNLFPAIEILDAHGNRVTVGASSTATIGLAIDSGVGSLGGNTLVAAVAGVATWMAADELNIDLVGAHVLSASSGGLAAANSEPFVVKHGPAAQLVWSLQPTDPVAAGQDILVMLEVRDVFGNTVTTGPDSAAEVTVAPEGASGALSGTMSKVAVNGVASFEAVESLNFTSVGMKQLSATKVATPSSGAIPSLPSNAFTVMHDVASELVWTTQPVDTPVGENLYATIEVRDAYGNLVTTGADADANISLALQGGSTGPINGTLILAATAGVAQWTAAQALNIGTSGSKTLRATKAPAGVGLLVRDSASFVVESLDAILGNLPPASSNLAALDVTVSGSVAVTDYKYKVGDVGIDCASAAGYSAPVVISSHITDSVGVDGAKRICVIGGNGSSYQDYASATQHTWTKDTVAPPSPTAITLDSPASSPGSDTTPTFAVNGIFTNVTVQLHLDSICSGSLASDYVPTGSEVQLTTSVLSEGVYTIYASTTDEAGNQACSAADASYTLDLTPPTVDITSTAGPTTILSPIPITVTASEPVVGLSAADFDVTNGTLQNFFPVNSQTYTFDVVPAIGPVMVTVSVPSGRFTDDAGNANAIGDALDVEYTGLIVSKIYPLNGADWNQYVEFDNDAGGTNAYDQDDEACTGTSQGYDACLHGAEKLFVLVNGFASCAGLTINDTLDAFEWDTCIPVGGNQVKWRTRGLKPGRGLRDLIDASGWLPNQVVVRHLGQAIATSVPGSWWNNPISIATDNSAGVNASTDMVNLSNPGEIYVIPANRSTLGFTINGTERVSLVTLGSVTLSYNGNGTNNCSEPNGVTAGPTLRAIICSSNSKFLWIEARLAGGTGNLAHTAAVGSGSLGWKNSRVHNTSIESLDDVSSAFQGTGLFLKNSRNNFISNLSVSHTRSGGVQLLGSAFNKFVNLNIGFAKEFSTRPGLINLEFGSDHNQFFSARLGFHSGFASAGVAILSSSQNIFSDINVSNVGSGLNNGSGFSFSGASGTKVTQASVSAVGGNGIDLASDNGSVFSHVTLSNNYGNGIKANGVTSLTTMNSIVSANSYTGVSVSADFNGAIRFFNSILANNRSGVAAYRDPASLGAISVIGHFSQSVGESNDADATLATVYYRDLADAFVGLLGTDDLANTSLGQANGAASYSATMDIFNFQNPFRAWGLAGIFVFPNAIHTGACGGGATCAIWDWRVKSSGPLHDVSGDSDAQNPAFSSGSPCPLPVSGAAVITVPGITFLKNAIELASDRGPAGVRIGNDNGLCESNEACVYAPNLGAYQGEGNLPIGEGNSCLFSSGTVTGATIYAYPISAQ